jgi:hypothetical protein
MTRFQVRFVITEDVFDTCGDAFSLWMTGEERNQNIRIAVACTPEELVSIANEMGARNWTESRDICEVCASEARLVDFVERVATVGE